MKYKESHKWIEKEARKEEKMRGEESNRSQSCPPHWPAERAFFHGINQFVLKKSFDSVKTGKTRGKNVDSYHLSLRVPFIMSYRPV